MFSHPSKDVNRKSVLSDGQLSDLANKVKQRAEQGKCKWSETPNCVHDIELCTVVPDVKQGGISCSGNLEQSCFIFLTCFSVCDSGIDRKIWGKTLVIRPLYCVLYFEEKLFSAMILVLTVAEVVVKSRTFT